MEQKKLVAILLVVVIAIPALILMGGGKDDTDEDIPSDQWVKLLVQDIKVSPASQDKKIYAGTIVEDSLDDDIIHLAATPLLTLGDVYNPLIFNSNDASERFVGLSGREVENLPSTDPVKETSSMAAAGWTQSDAVVIVSNINDALQAAPMAAFLEIPILYANGSIDDATAEAASKIGAKYCIAVGEAPRLSMNTMRLPSIEINDFFLRCLALSGDGCDYMTITNPKDMYAYSWGEDDHIPIPYLSLVSAQLAAYRQSPIFFTNGFDNLTVGGPMPEYTQMGADPDEAWELAKYTRNQVKQGKELITQRTGYNDTMYLALVGGPVALPFHYEHFESVEGATTFSNTDYIASDYFYGDLDEDAQMEIAVGRIIARDVTDASVVVARSLLDESREFVYEEDNDFSQTFYNALAPEWTDNSGVFIGATRTGPLPGCLKNAKQYQIQTMRAGGFTPTPVEANKGYDMTVEEVIDKVQYSVYYGHGNHDTWWVNMAVGIKADTIAASNLKPGSAIAMACLTARVDNMTTPLSEDISLAFLHGGYNTYIGATRLAYGLVEVYSGTTTGRFLEDQGALYLVDKHTTYVCTEDLPVGLALMKARNDMIERYGEGDFPARVAMYEYVLYGDPAYNMHIPNIDA